jgi:hypothetical protein
MTPDAFSASLERSAAKHPPSKARRIAALLPQIEAAMAQGSPRAHIVTALLDVGIEVTPHQLSNVIARLRRQREDAPGLPEARPALGAGIPESGATVLPAAQDRQRSHARACTFSCTGRQSGIEIRCARPSPPGRGHAQHARHESTRQVGAETPQPRKVMKVCVLNFSGNVGKSTIAAHLLQPRLNAQVFSVESLNVDASSDGVEVARLRGKHYNDLLQRLMKLDDAIVDVGSSNVEDFLKMMQHYADSQEEFDLFVVPVVKDGKQQADTVNTIRALRAIGVPAAKILVLINKVETDDDLRTDFAGVFGFCASGEATIPEGGVIFANELFAMLKTQQLSIGALNDDATDYRQRLRVAANEDEQDAAIQMIAMKRLAKTCNKNLDTAFAALFPQTLQASLALSVAA